jgi:lysophospholipase L1-like esterase
MVRILLAAALLLTALFRPQTAGANASPAPSCARTTGAAKISSGPIVAFGDGITWGVNARRNCVRGGGSIRPILAHVPAASDTTYPADLARLLHAGVLDYGVRGEATNAGLKRIAAVVEATHPSQVLLLEGITDLLRGDTPTVIASRLILMAQIIQSYGAKPVLLTLYLPAPSQVASSRVRMLNVFVRNEAAILAYRVIDLSRVFRGRKNVLAGGLYPTDRGYQLLAAAVAAKLKTKHA